MIVAPMNRRRRLLIHAIATAGIAGLLPSPAASQGKRRIGIVGSGRVGSAIGAAWIKAGHQVMFSSLDIEHDRALAAKLGPNGRAGTPREAAAFGEVLMISVPYGALPQVGKELGALLRRKVVIDTCNPFVSRDGEVASRALEKGAGLMSAELLPGARIVRAFNAIAAARMGSAREESGRIGMPIASDDAEAVKMVSPLIRDIGYVPVLVGGLAMGRHLVPGTALSGEHSPQDIARIAETLSRR